MRILSLATICLVLISVLAVGRRDNGPASAAVATTDAATAQRRGGASGATSDRIRALDRLVTHLEDVESIKRLQFVYGYYQDKFFVDRVVDLFSDNATADYEGGKYVGKESIRRLFLGRFTMPEAQMKQGPQYGLINDHYQMQNIVDVASDGKTAKARFRDLITKGVYGREQSFSAGIYENDYVKENGIWKISSMVYCEQWHQPYKVNLHDVPLPSYPPHWPKLYPEDPSGPDRISNYACHPWPHAGITPPMHYPHPITGEFIYKP
jgi:SnoaL-like domain